MMHRIRLRTVLVLIAFLALGLTIVLQEVRLRRREAELRAALNLAIEEREMANVQRVHLLNAQEILRRAQQVTDSEASPPGESK
jgi:hypothetical protein